MKSKKKKQTRKSLTTKANRLLQDYMRIKHKGERCEICGKPFTVSHHFIPKKNSIALRYDEKNLILLCRDCHFRIHRTPKRYALVAQIGLQRGGEWIEYINTHNIKSKPLGVKFLKEKIEYYEKKIK